jgi:quinoprotein glucose dehydrogenase
MTGKELWTVKLPAVAHSTPMTYSGPKNGKQYIAIAVGGIGKKITDELVVYALP